MLSIICKLHFAIDTVATTMSSLQDLAVLEDSSAYPTWADLRLALDNWAVGAKFTHRTPTEKKDRARYICSASGCTWCCNATRKPDSMLELRVTKRQHTCLRATITKHSSCLSKGWLDEAVMQHLLVLKTMKPQAIVNTIAIHYTKKISYKVAQMCVLQLLDGRLG
jgi:hypothetical protein